MFYLKKADIFVENKMVKYNIKHFTKVGDSWYFRLVSSLQKSMDKTSL